MKKFLIAFAALIATVALLATDDAFAQNRGGGGGRGGGSGVSGGGGGGHAGSRHSGGQFGARHGNWQHGGVRHGGHFRGWHGSGAHWGWRGPGVHWGWQGSGVHWGWPWHTGFFPQFGFFGPVAAFPVFQPVFQPAPLVFVESPASGAMSPVPAPAPKVLWYYCNEPAGYYPYVQECNSPWVKVIPPAPASTAQVTN